MGILRRRLLLASAGAACSRRANDTGTITVKVQLLLDDGAHNGTGLTRQEADLFFGYQQKATREFATSGIGFDLQSVAGAYVRKQGRSIIPDQFLARDRINLFVTESLAYDIDRDRTGGSSSGPPFYRIFLGLRDAGESTLIHEYAHHFTGDTKSGPSATGNLWSDLRNDYWIRRQRGGTAIAAFRACRDAPWTRA